MDAHHFLQDLSLVLSVAAVTTVVFQKLGQPVVLGYLLAGAIISPNTPIPISADLGTIHMLSELGVILLMFSLGLEFSLRKLFKVGPRAAFVAVVQCSFMIWVGLVVGRAFGWTQLESLFAGAAIAISSTTIIVKAFQEQNITGPNATLVYAVLIVEDLVAILLLAVLTPLAKGATISAGSLLFTVGQLAVFLVVTLVVGYLTIPRAVRAVLKLNRPETTLVACVGTCFGIAYLAQAAGYSVALGAFLAGSLVAESGEEKKIEHLIQPVRDMFAAIFFVAVGMLLDPKLIAENWLAVVVLSLVVIVGKLIGVGVGSFLAGYGTKASVSAGLSLAQIGEFSFIIASVGLTLGAVRPFLYPVAVAVSAVTTLTTPWLIRLGPRAAEALDHHLPRPVQTFASLYSAWIERLGQATGGASFGRDVRRAIRLLLVDAACIALIIFAASLYQAPATALIQRWLPSFGPRAAHALIVLNAAFMCLPFLVGILRSGNSIAQLSAAQVFPEAADELGLQRVPRRTLVAAIQLAVILLAGVPLVAITQPVIASFQGALIFGAAIGVAGLAMWRSARDLDDQVRAGAQTVVDALERALPTLDLEPSSEHSVPEVGVTRGLKLGERDYAVGRTLRELDLRGRTGAMVIALERGTRPAVVPSPHEPLHDGDVLALAGTRDAIAFATELLRGGGQGSALTTELALE